MTEYVGGAPIRGEALALDLMNTWFAVRGKERDGIRSAADLDAWIAQLEPRLIAKGASDAAAVAATDADVDRFKALRAAARGVARAAVDGVAAKPSHIAAINAASQAAPRWAAFTPGAGVDGSWLRSEQFGSGALEQVFAALATDAIDLITGDQRARLRACQAPGCPLFYLKDHPRREWCSPACGARVRAARAYRKRTAALSAG
ncbi:ABATE domain-containing protein [Diaminobutyricimonas sp. TR449]|uniref:ABATE domain-containing protein n=1 Tax=Diaminobutyricimonas sp. TR449 TaxID=2708076 RepID=UPI0014233829|nr:ABATE domain-containing protein [Diaminobutyricimonas sp. TR449]